MVNLKLTYFDGKGRAEPSRLALAIGGVPFTDDRITGDKFVALKSGGSLPFGQVPVLQADDVTVTQSGSILRYCGKLAGLYTRDDDVLARAIDEVIGVLDDTIASAYKEMRAGPEQLKSSRKEFVETVVPLYVGGLERIVKKRKAGSKTPWICGDTLTIADLYLYCLVSLMKNGVLDHVPESTVNAAQYPHVMASYTAVAEHPKVIAWNEKHPWKK